MHTSCGTKTIKNENRTGRVFRTTKIKAHDCIPSFRTFPSSFTMFKMIVVIFHKILDIQICCMRTQQWWNLNQGDPRPFPYLIFTSLPLFLAVPCQTVTKLNISQMHPNSFYATTLSLISLKKEPFENSATKIGDFPSPHEWDTRISTLRKSASNWLNCWTKCFSCQYNNLNLKNHVPSYLSLKNPKLCHAFPTGRGVPYTQLRGAQGLQRVVKAICNLFYVWLLLWIRCI